MSLATALLTPILGDASPWGPQRLFQLGEAGAWYDPSDLTAEKVAWRRNLLTWSEDFTNAAWSPSAVTVAANNVVAPDGTLTAETVTDTAANGDHYLENAATGIVYETGVTYTMSLRAKNVSLGYVFLGISKGINTYAVAEFDIATGTVNRTAAVGAGWSVVSSSVSSLGSGWFLCTASIRIGVSAGEDREFFGLSNGIGAFDARGRPNYAGTLQSVALWGAQLERGSTATAYQRITDFTSDFLAAFPTHALYQDSAGTTPVTALGQPVGLAIDKSRGGLASLGAELVTNGDFSSGGTGWINQDPVRWTFSGGTANHTAGGTLGPYQSIGTVSGKTFLVTFTVTSISAGNVRLEFGGGAAITASRSTVGTFSQPVFVSSGNGNLVIASSSDFVGSIDNISVREVPGVHAIQPTSASRPLLDGRVNLLTRSEEFNDAVWTKADTTVTANATTAPNGTTTADSLLETATTAAHAIYQAASVTSGASYQWTGYVRANGRTRIRLVCAATSAVLTADYNISAITATVAAGSGTVSIESIGSGWFRLFATATATATGTGYWQANLLDDNGNLSYLGDVTKGMFIWGADLRLATDAAYPYQRVAAATDYADVGVPRSFLFDGFDDSLYTASNMDLSGTDKVTVLAGVRKLSDVAIPVIVEHGPTSSANVGFTLFGPRNTFTGDYGFRSTGALISPQDATTTAIYPAPITNVVTGIANIGGPSVLIRVNGTQAAVNTTTQGATNYLSTLLNVGRRNNASAPFNGKAYQLIVRGALTDTATLAQAERYVGAKTGLYL